MPSINLAAGEQQVEQIVDISALFNKAIKNIYKNYGETQPLVEKHLFEISNKTLQQGIDKTFKAAGVEFGRQNADFISQFKNNTAVFNAFKNHQQTNDIAALLTKDGKLRSFSEFKREALKISTDYNKTWLQTEYNTAVRSARMAANWKQIERTRDIYPRIEYMPSSSANPRDSHRMLWNTIRPIDDPFWDTYCPPSDWNCKCSIRPVKTGTTDIPVNLPQVKPVFANNPGKTTEFVSIKETPYYKNTDPDKRHEILGQFKGLSEAENEIRKIKTHEVVVAFDDLGNTVLKKSGEITHVNINTDEMKLLKDTVFTHNHPSAWRYPDTSMLRIGNSFSPDDIITAINADVKELRAVTPNYTFIMKRPIDGWPNSIGATSLLDELYFEVKEEFQNRIDSGTTTPSKAQIIHAHEVSKRFAKIMEIDYKKIKAI